jgi:hypothetical protein
MTNMRIASYFEQLKSTAGSEDALREAFKRAGVASSTFYRARLGTDMRHSVAARVAEHIEP